jgi:hypothetical protein
MNSLSAALIGRSPSMINLDAFVQPDRRQLARATPVPDR